MRRRKKSRTDEPFQMAPMIDMVFLLLVFFMTVSTLARDSRPEIELAESVSAAVPEEAPPRDVITVFQEDGSPRIFWHNREVSPGELESLLRESGNKDPGGQILLRGQPGLPWSAWDGIIGRIREAGFREIVFATFEA